MTNPDTQIIFESADILQEYISDEIADFVRDCEFEISQHPMDYEAHFNYIKGLYFKYLERQNNG